MPNLDFFIIGNGPVILFLHGWGQNKEMMLGLANKLKSRYKCVLVDMPGFGKSDFNGEKNVKEYTKTIHDFLHDKLNIDPSYIVGHSFGGKIALEYYFNYGIKGITLIASPVLKPKRKINYYFNIIMYKIKKKLKCNVNKYGSRDFKECKKEMKSFFVNVVNTHYDKKILKVRVPVLLVYSRKDEKVNFRSARKLHNKLLRSRLRVINGDHFAYLSNEEIVSVEIHDFFKEREKHVYYL